MKYKWLVVFGRNKNRFDGSMCTKNEKTFRINKCRRLEKILNIIVTKRSFIRHNGREEISKSFITVWGDGAK